MSLYICDFVGFHLVLLFCQGIIYLVSVPDIWQWSELTSFGDLPSPRDFAAASAIGNRKIVMWVLIGLHI